MGRYKFYLGDFLIPVTPGAVSFKVGSKNKTIDLINEGEINILKPPGLTEISFDYEIAAFVRPYEGSLIMPEDQIQYLEGFKNSQKPFWFKIIRTEEPTVWLQSELVQDTGRGTLEKVKQWQTPSSDGREFDQLYDTDRYIQGGRSLASQSSQYLKHTLFDQNLKVTLEDYSWSQDQENQGQDIKVSVTLKLYRDWGTKIVNFSTDHKTATITETRAIDDPPKRLKYTVVEGDTLWEIAKVKLGNGEYYKQIYEENKAVINEQEKKDGVPYGPDWVVPGMVLEIPAYNPNGDPFT